jgi:hypothetical protein
VPDRLAGAESTEISWSDEFARFQTLSDIPLPVSSAGDAPVRFKTAAFEAAHFGAAFRTSRKSYQTLNFARRSDWNAGCTSVARTEERT